MKVFVEETISKAENYHDEITEHLGLKRSIFWTWENRCKIYFYRDQPDY
ncbi:MAG: hypothetical protein KAJ79_05260 [Candidatus Omnitrophica bacterium]|nr:hypothetical protein [Candidatus Omnitrophota bacterium]